MPGTVAPSPLPLAPTMARPRSPDNTPKPARSFPDTGHPLGLAVKDPAGEVGSVAHGRAGATPHRVGNARTGLMQELALLFESVRAGCAEPVGTLR